MIVTRSQRGIHMSNGDLDPSLRAERLRVIEEFMGSTGRRTVKQSRKYGKTLRKAVPRDVFASWVPASTRPDAAELVLSQDAMRVEKLVPVRHERMAASSFAFYRGAALVMASDMSTLPTTGIEVQVCGDAHISNFGLYLSPERHTVFDINDFDETCRGPWEWDVARLAASVEICGRHRGFSPESREKAVCGAVRMYRQAMWRLSDMGNMEVWYAHADMDALVGRFAGRLDKKTRKKFAKTMEKSKKKNSTRAIERLTEIVNGQLCVKSDPPLIVPLRNLLEYGNVGEAGEREVARIVARVLTQYKESLPPERVSLLESYHGVDMAHKVVGVGSVGLQAWIIVLEGVDEHDALVLQVKEATSSVLERFVGSSPYENNGQRVVEGQHAMQTVSDMFLGWTRLRMPDGREHDYYVRQLWDGKGSIDLETIGEDQLVDVAMACGITLAHAHARTGDRHAIASYLGKKDVFDKAMLQFARMYAQQNERDYQRFLQATKSEKGQA